MASDLDWAWAVAFAGQARLDLDFAAALHRLLLTKSKPLGFDGDPRYYYPFVLAHCQQAIEKALKAWLWRTEGRHNLSHNPLSDVMRNRKTRRRNRPALLDFLDRKQTEINRVLDLAPGGGRSDREALRRRENTEYPFLSADGVVRRPYEVPLEPLVVPALRIGQTVVSAVEKDMEMALAGGISESAGPRR